MKIGDKNVWITADTHYGHTNIVKGTTKWNLESERDEESVRDFETVEDMNDTMVENINGSVDRNDWLIHLGDWSFGGFEKIEEFRSRINCNNIVLILGNHDHHIFNNKNDVRNKFESVHRMEDLYITNKKKIVMCHYPIVSWEGMRRDNLMLHGHQHLLGDNRFGQGKRMDIGIPGSPEFRPYHISEIIDLLKDRVF